MAAQKLQSWFCLKDGRDNFKPHNVKDKGLTFCHQHLLTDEILGSIERRFAGNEPVKMLLYGDWGVGKTHAINHICWWLDAHKEDYPAKPIVIEIGDITKTTRFDVIVGPFIDAVTLPELIELMHAYLKLNANAQKGLEDAGVSSPVAGALAKLLLAAPGQAPPPMVLHAIDYLKGRKLTGAAASMGFGQQLNGSSDFYNVLLGIGALYKAVRGARLIFIADEAAKVEAVDADDAARAHWVNVNKLIFDDTNNTFGFVYTISGRRRALPQALFEPQLQNRLGENAFEMKNLAPADVGNFLTSLVAEFVDRSAVDSLVVAGAIAATEYSWDSYPFTVAGKSDFVEFFSRTQENSKPRDISSKLNDVAFIAMKSGKRLIDPDVLRAANM